MHSILLHVFVSSFTFIFFVLQPLRPHTRTHTKTPFISFSYFLWHIYICVCVCFVCVIGFCLVTYINPTLSSSYLISFCLPLVLGVCVCVYVICMYVCTSLDKCFLGESCRVYIYHDGRHTHARCVCVCVCLEIDSLGGDAALYIRIHMCVCVCVCVSV